MVVDRLGSGAGRVLSACSMLRLVPRRYFDYRRSMDVGGADARLSAVAAAIAEPARTQMLCRLLDGCARTSTELAIVAGVSPSTASVHLARLAREKLVKVTPQGRHRYYSLCDANVAAAIEALILVAGAPREPFEPATPDPLRSARTCYDHMAGRLAVALHDSLFELRWLSRSSENDYDVTRKGVEGFAELDVDVAAARAARRRFACGCLDWSERRPHLAGALGAALLASALRRGWMIRDLNSRALAVTRKGRRALRERFGVEV
jgi:DNA-binding transcriptional ArsR family regulator